MILGLGYLGYNKVSEWVTPEQSTQQQAQHPAATPTPTHDVEQKLDLTGYGSLVGGPENRRLDGQCRMATYARGALQCDVRNGFPDWEIKEITFFVRTKAIFRSGTTPIASACPSVHSRPQP